MSNDKAMSITTAVEASEKTLAIAVRNKKCTTERKDEMINDINKVCCGYANSSASKSIDLDVVKKNIWLGLSSRTNIIVDMMVY